MSATSPLSHDRPNRSWLERLWSSIAEHGRVFVNLPNDDLPSRERAELLADALLGGRGEASGAALAAALLGTLRGLAPHERITFCEFLATGFEPDADRLQDAARAYLGSPDAATAAALATAAEPPRQELLRRMNMAPGGTGALIDMRREVLAELPKRPSLAPLDSDLRHLFASWFNRGFLELRRIDWRTPAFILEKLIAYEAVHEIQGWDDLRRRLAPDRRCFAFFHPALPDEPLIFVEVALVKGLAEAIGPLLAPAADDDAAEHAQQDAAARANTAIFYSISNCQEGLRGISFGNFLIKQVVAELQSELANLRKFSTLSPVPGLRRAIRAVLDSPSAPLLAAEEREAIGRALGTAPAADTSAEGDANLLKSILEDRPWWTEAPLAAALRGPLLRLAALYLTGAWRANGVPAAARPDPVARFHLGNGARLERINWLGNTSPRGVAESFGVMVNYLYDPDAIEARHEAYLRDGTVARAAAVDQLMAPPGQSWLARRTRGLITTES
ncbi:malonyl-CoA decarboxylase [Acidiphilium sp.]|uniref:malonyl-CoA decarboxylase n=1 Tax=Acidiphilium sp. TaxID=527 RepID=UPI00258DA56B|nr:malonyl-CoA decarboxylase [Acidiphilium sp.]